MLRAAAIEDAPFEAELLLRHVLGVDRACFYLRLPDALDPRQDLAYRDLLEQRRGHRPSAYITGHREFYDLDLHVAPGVLIPRPETELVVEHCLRLLQREVARSGHASFVDVGTGSGAIALVVAGRLPSVDVLALDCSPAALAIAAFNARRLRLSGRVRFEQGDLLVTLRGTVDVVAANLPYIPTATIKSLAPEVRDFEPSLALDGGADGLDLIRRLLAQLPGALRPGGSAVLEIGADQGDAVREIAFTSCATACTVVRDLTGRERVAIVTL